MTDEAAKVEELMAEIVERIAADPRMVIDPRAWSRLLIYAPRDLKQQQPNDAVYPGFRGNNES